MPLLLKVLLAAACAYVWTILLAALFDWDSATPAEVLGGVTLIVPFCLRVRWYRRYAKGEFRLYEHGLVALTAGGREAVYLWASTAVFTDGQDRYKLRNPEGAVVTLRGTLIPQQDEWSAAILAGVRDAQAATAAETVRGGGDVAFGDLVVSRGGLTVRRRRGRDDFTMWEDVGTISLSAEGALVITSRGGDFPTYFTRPRFRIPNLEILLDIARRLLEGSRRPVSAPVGAPPEEPPPGGLPPDEPAPDSPADEESEVDVSAVLSVYVVVGIGGSAAWSLAARQEIDGPGGVALAVVAAVFGGFFGALAGLGLSALVSVVPKVAGEFLVEAVIRWFRHGRYVAAVALALGAAAPPVALLLFLFTTFPSRLVPLAMLLFFGGWCLLLMVRRCGASERRLVRRLPDLPGVFLVVVAVEQFVSGDVLTVAPAAGLFFPVAFWLSWRGWRRLQESPRMTVRAAADLVLSVELGLLLAVLVVWLANVLSLTPPQVTVVRGTVEELGALTEVPWQYWLAAYGLLAFGSYVVLRWPERVARAGRRLRPARFAAVRLPVGAGADFVRRSLSGISVGIMVCLLFLVVLAPVSEGAWKREVAERYALELERQRYAEGAEDAYREIHRQVTAHPRSAARLGAVILAVHREAPSQPGEPVDGTALDVARQVGRFQAATLAVDDAAPGPSEEAPESGDLADGLDRLDESQERTAEREQRTERFAERAAVAITSALDLVDLGDSQTVQLVKEYLAGLIEDGPVRMVFQRWGQGVGGPPPDGDRLVRVDVARLTAAAYERTRAAVERADADLFAFYNRFGIGIPAEDASPGVVVDLANQHRYLDGGTGSCAGCVGPADGGGTTGGGGGRR